MNMKINNQSKEKLNPRKVFWNCGACSHAMYHMLNHEFDNVRPAEEKASDFLAGGIGQKGEQCGMIWGASLAIGTECYKQFSNSNRATSVAVLASKNVLDSFQSRTNTVNCRDISKVDWENKLEFAFYMLKIVMRGFIFSPCFNLFAKWSPEAINAANNVLKSNHISDRNCLSCASEVIKRMGGTEEEIVTVAGLAGGIGLSGNGCGALAAVIWYKQLFSSKTEPEKKQPFFNNADLKKTLRIFYIQTNSEMTCRKISGTEFKDIYEHTAYIENGGCKSLLDALSEVRN